MENKVKILEKELKYLTNEAKVIEIEKNKFFLEQEDVNIKKLANDIYLNRGIDISKLNHNLTSNVINDLNLVFTDFASKDKVTKRNMIIDLVYLIIIIVLLKIPFNLIRDIGYEYIEIIWTNSTFYALWNLLFLVLYTITVICTVITLIKNFNKKYLK